MAWRMAVESFKWGAPQRRVVRNIVPELSKWKLAKPFRGTGVYRAPEKSFKALVEAFSLAVGLGMVGRAHQKLGVCQTEHLLPPLACEHFVTIGDVIRPKRIYFPEHFCYCFSSNLCVLNTTNTD
jgi:hypothetical protein